MPKLESLWLFVIVGGPLLLGAVLAYGAIRGRRRSRAQMAETARGAQQTQRR